MKTLSQEHRDSARRRPDSSDFQLCRRVSWIRMFILLLFLFGINSFFLYIEYSMYIYFCFKEYAYKLCYYLKI